MLLSTPRLSLSRLTLADAPFILELLNSPAWLEFIGDRNVHSIEDAEGYLTEKVLPGYENGGLAGWKVTLSSTGETIGNCGFYQRDFLDMPDLGFAFLPQFIGKGYGYESAKACLEYGVENMNIERCCAITDHKNKASIGLLKKLGFEEKGITQWPGDDAELLLFEWAKA